MKLSTHQPKIIVVGSSSIDLVMNTVQPALPGETVMAAQSENFFGGKGANQAVACSRLGASVYLIGRVGMDPYGQQILRHLKDEGVNVAYISEDQDEPTGTAYVTSFDGKNSIVVVPSANRSLTPKKIEMAKDLFETADIVLVQLETSSEVLQQTYELCKKNKKRLGIYAAPATKLSDEIVNYATFIVAKKNDLSILFGEERKEVILQKLPNKLFIRNETNTTIYYDGEEMRYYQKEPENKAHNMGMGDAFTAGFAVALCHGNPIKECVKFGNDISLRVSAHRGSQRGLPHLRDLELK